MALTLTETASLTKKLFIFGIIFVVLITIGFIGYRIYLSSKPVIQLPGIEEKPDTKFNLLPKPDFDQSKADSSNFKYELLTTTGKLPTDMPKIMKVYFISKLGASLLAANRAKDLANDFEYTLGPEILNSTLYKYTDEAGGDITINLDTGNFEFKKNIASDSGDLEEGIISDQAKIAEEFKSLLSDKGLLKDLLKDSRTKVTYDDIDQQSSEFAVVSLWQDDIKDGENKYPVVTADFQSGLIKAVYTKHAEMLNKFPNLEYIYWSIDPTNYATYPIKTVEHAYEELTSGKGNVVINPNKEYVAINSVYLGYLISKDYTKYLQPVFVFEGDNFAALVPAVNNEFLENTEESLKNSPTPSSK